MNNQRQNPIQQAEFSFMGASTTNTTSGSFSDLLNSSFVVGDDDGGYKLFSPGNGGGSRITEKNGSSVGGVPKFKSVPPPSLPISPPYFAMPPGLSPSELLDSPVLLSSSDIFPSPTTGAIAAQSSIWKQKQHQEDHAATIKQEDNNLSDFTFPTQKTPNDTTVALKAREQQQQREQERRGIAVHQHHHQQENKLENQSQPSQQQQIQLYGREQKKSDDGYNWRKYGQKQVKGSENPRSYYKCTFPSCPMKKKIEKSLVDGQITEIVYKGSHNHLKPANTRRSSATGGGGVGYLTSSAAAAPCQSGFKGCGLNFNNDSTQDQENSSFGSGQSVATPEMENSSISMADDFETDGVSDSHRSRSAAGDEYDHVDQRDAKRWKAGEGESECMSAAPAGLTGSSRTVREPRVVVQTTSDIDILDDGYRWRKYGQKVVKGNPNPRSYYKCTYAGCQVRKHVERAAHDYGAVITTYEGKHNHDVPAARGVSNGSHRPPPSENNNGNSYSYMSGGLNMAVRPLASYEPRLSSTSQQQGQQYHAHQLQSSQAPFTLEMLQNPGAAPGTSVGLENSAASYGYGNEQIPQHDHWLHYYNTTTNNNNNNVNNMMMMNGHYNGNNTTGSIINSRGAKDEPVRDDAFLESLLC